MNTVALERVVIRRGVYAGLALFTIGIGLATHYHAGWMHPVVRDMLGDALWAMMMFWLVSVVAPRALPLARGAVALGICWLVEFAQLVHLPALDAFRATSVGHLTLGSGFDARDLLSYALGVVAAVLIGTLIGGLPRARATSVSSRRT